MQDLEGELARLKIDPTNPYMECLAELINPPVQEKFETLLRYYQTLVPGSTGKKREVLEKIIEAVKKKYKETNI